MKIIFGLSPLLVGLTGLMMSAYIACSRDFLVLISAIQSNPWFESQKRSQGTSSFTSRWNLVYSAAVFVWVMIGAGLLQASKY